jgi:type IV secretion system protein VirB10
MKEGMQPSDERVDRAPTPEASGAIRDRRAIPRGVLPRHVQMWLMVGIAVVIVGIILLTGQPQPTPRPASSARPAEPSLVSPERVRSYEQALAAEAARQQQALAQEQQAAARSRVAAGGAAARPSTDPLTDEQRRREYQSLFAGNVAFSRRPTDRQPYDGRFETPNLAAGSLQASSPDLALLQQLLQAAPAGRATPPAQPGPAPGRMESSERATPVPAPERQAAASGGTSPDAPAPPPETGPIPPGGPVTRILEGTVIETVLLNRLDGTFAGPVTCLVTTPVYSHDRQAIVIPAGARVLGSSSPVQTWGDSRLAVSFHRLVMPDGRTHSLERFKGLNQIGDTGLKGQVNRHYWQVFGASLAIGGISGLAQWGTRSGFDSYTFGDSYRQAAGSSLAASAGRVLDRYLNVLPTITIREGYRIKVYLTNDLELPLYAPITQGGAR